MTAPTIVVAGVDALADELERASSLGVVLRAATVTAMLELIRSDLRGARPDSIVFIIADGLPQGEGSFTLDAFLEKVCSAGYRPILLPLAYPDNRMQQRHPQCAVLPAPITANGALWAIAALGHPGIEPLQDGSEAITALSTPVEPARPATRSDGPPVARVDAPALPTPAPTPAAPVAGQGPASGWQVPQESTPAWQPAPTPAPTPAPAWQPAGTTGDYSQPNSSWQAAPAQDPPTPAPTPAPGESTSQVTAGSHGWQPPPSPIAPIAPIAPIKPIAMGDWQPAAQAAGSAGSVTGRRSLADLASSSPVADTWQRPDPGPSPADVLSGPAWGYGPTARPDAASVEQHARRGYVITIAVSKGGTGKSSLTLNLAAFLGMRLRAQRKTVCVVDANFQQADAGKYLNTYVPNINDIAHDPSILTDPDPQRLLRSLVHKTDYNLSVLLGPATPNEASPMAINHELYNRVLDRLLPHYDYVFIDTPVAEKFHSLFSGFALPRSNFIIVPVAPNLATLQNADNWLQEAVTAPVHLGGAGIDPARIGVVLNRAEEGIGLTTLDAQAEMGRWQFLGSIPETKEWKAANNNNELVAPKNYVELNQAFAQVLYYATGEQVLAENFATAVSGAQPSGLLARLRSRKGR